MADIDKFKRAREKSSFIQNINSDIVNPSELKKITTRNKSEIQIEPNKLDNKNRSRTKQGRNITVPLYVEELTIIEATAAKISEINDISINSFIRETLLLKCRELLGEQEYEKLSSIKYNVVKNK